MFDIDHVAVALRKLALKIVDHEDASGSPTRERQCECTFKIPILDHSLASVIRLPIVSHCFGRDRLPLWGVHEVHFEPLDQRYRVALASAVDMPAPLATLDHAEIIKVRVWRPNKEKREIALEFVTRHVLARGDARDLAELLAAWETSAVHVTLATVQLPLALGGGEEAEAPEKPEPPARGRRTH